MVAMAFNCCVSIALWWLEGNCLEDAVSEQFPYGSV